MVVLTQILAAIWSTNKVLQALKQKSPRAHCKRIELNMEKKKLVRGKEHNLEKLHDSQGSKQWPRNSEAEPSISFPTNWLDDSGPVSTSMDFSFFTCQAEVRNNPKKELCKSKVQHKHLSVTTLLCQLEGTGCSSRELGTGVTGWPQT